MSLDNPEIVRGVRTPVSVAAVTTQRTRDEQLFVRFPVVARAFALAWSRLPPSSRLRRAFIARSTRRLAEAWNRRDFDCLLPVVDPDVEFEAPESLVGGFLPPDQPRVHHGPEGYIHMWEALIEVWGDLKLQPEEVIDRGDRLLAAGRITGHGRQSGVHLDMPLFQVATLRGGLIVRQQDFGERGRALEAAGLSE